MIPIFITLLFAFTSILYVVTLVYLQQNKGISTKNAAIWLIVYSAILVGIFLGIPASYNTNINDSQRDFDKHKDEKSISGKLKDKWIEAVSLKNKYFISWFIALLYVPILFHYLFRCEINPMMYSSLYLFFKHQFAFADKNGNQSIPPITGVLNILNEIDKLGIKYTKDEETLFKTIRDAMKDKKDIVLESHEIETLKTLRYHIENKKLWSRLKNMSIPNIGAVIPNINATFLYLLNVIIISVVSFYTYIYNYDQSYFMIPLFTCTISLVIYYLNGV
jgi:hypothetical protein